MDLALLKPVSGTRQTMAPFTAPSGATGPRLLGQRVLHLLLRTYDPVFDRGTNLITRIRNGGISGAAAKSFVTLAMAKVVTQLPDVSDPTERLAAFRVVAVTTSGDRISISLRLTTVSGETATITATTRTA